MIEDKNIVVKIARPIREKLATSRGTYFKDVFHYIIMENHADYLEYQPR